MVVNSASSVEAGERVASSLGDAIYVQADVSVESDAQRLVQAAVERWGRLDIVVNNAGWTKLIPHHDLDSATDDVWEKVWRVNVMGPWFVTKAALPHLRRDGGGCVVNVASIAGIRPTGSSIPYATSKAALCHLTRLLANVAGPAVRVNAVAPGLIETPWTADWGPVHQHVAATAPLARSGTPEDVAAAIVGVIDSPYMTGEIVLVDGGLSLRQ